MSKSKTVADYYLVTASTPRVHVRHLAVDGHTQQGGFGRTPMRNTSPVDNERVTHPLCGTGDEDSRYRFADDEEARLPICKRCRRRLGEYIMNLAAEQA